MSNAKGFVVAIGLVGGMLVCGSPSHAQVYPQEGLRAVDGSARYRVRHYGPHASFRPVYVRSTYKYSRFGWRHGLSSQDWIAIHGGAAR